MNFRPVPLLEVLLRGPGGPALVGRLAARERRIFFEYDAHFLKSGLELSPIALPLQPGVFEEGRRVFEGLFGLFWDSLPDGWGRLLLDREMSRLGVQRGQIGPLDRLAWVGGEGMGALSYRPAIEREPSSLEIDLPALAQASRRILEDREEALLPQLLALGGSPGGARPKVLVGWSPAAGALLSGVEALPPGFEPYLIKFHSRRDEPDSGAVEQVYAEMARAAGIDLPESRLFAAEGHPGFFGVRRFDRVGGERLHVHSFAGLVHSDPRIPSPDYADLLAVARHLTRDQRDLEQLFRRAAFNVLAHNRDDHSRNFSFTMSPEGEWRLAPAYDLTFAEGPGGEHWMSVAGEGRAPGPPHLLELARRVGLPAAVARRLIEEVRAGLSLWPSLSKIMGIKPLRRAEIGGRIGAV